MGGEEQVGAGDRLAHLPLRTEFMVECAKRHFQWIIRGTAAPGMEFRSPGLGGRRDWPERRCSEGKSIPVTRLG